MLAAIALVVTILAARAEERGVDLKLVLAVDASGSVDESEFALQMGGIAAAFRDPAVGEAIRSGPKKRIAVNVTVWAQHEVPKDSTGWALLSTDADIDRFSQINERCGRVAGDLVLQHVAQILRKRTARPESWVARDQADAFVICLPGMKNSVARRLATSLRVAVMGERLPLEGCEITTTCSFAVRSVACEEELSSAQSLLLQAREQAALAKKSGGNMVL